MHLEHGQQWFYVRGSDKIKYGELIHDFSIQYTMNTNQYQKKLHEAVDGTRKVKFKPEKNNDRINTKNSINMEVVR